MSSLREEIAGLKLVEYVNQPTPVESTAYNEALRDVLALIDKHEAKMRTAFVPDETLSDERKLGYRLGVQDVLGSLAGHVKIEPSDERPAKTDSHRCACGTLYMGPINSEACPECELLINGTIDERPAREALKIVLVPKEDVSPLNWSDDTQSMAICTRAIVEAIDALTAATKEAKQ